MKIYIAAPFFSPQQLSIVENVEFNLDALGLEFFSPRSEGVLKDMSKEEQKKSRKDIYDSNLRHMDECTHMIACVEFKDTGTSFEIGYYASAKKPIVLYSQKISTVNVMLAEAAISICDSSDLLGKALMGRYTVEIEDVT